MNDLKKFHQSKKYTSKMLYAVEDFAHLQRSMGCG
jgi:hypothetical protein